MYLKKEVFFMKFTWGILGASNIANAFSSAVLQSEKGKLGAIASRDIEKAKDFADKHNIPKYYGNYEDLLTDDEIDGIYISTPNPMHTEWAIKAANAKKHILLEKPATLNYAEALEVIDNAKANGVFFMEAFMYRCHPQTKKTVDIIKEGLIGDVRFIDISFGFKADFNKESRLFAKHLGGGGILDVGCYTASLARLLAGSAMNKDFANPIELKATGVKGITDVDEWTSAVLKFENNIIGNISCAVGTNMQNTALISGTKGTITVTSPFACNPGQDNPAIIVTGETNEIYKFENMKSLFTYEADIVTAYALNGKAPSPAMTPEDTLGNMKTLDMWRKEVGVIYEKEINL